jgi:hypothetical protein
MDPAWQSFVAAASSRARALGLAIARDRSPGHPDSHTLMSSALRLFYYPEEEAVRTPAIAGNSQVIDEINHCRDVPCQEIIIRSAETTRFLAP